MLNYLNSEENVNSDAIDSDISGVNLIFNKEQNHNNNLYSFPLKDEIKANDGYQRAFDSNRSNNERVGDCQIDFELHNNRNVVLKDYCTTASQNLHKSNEKINKDATCNSDSNCFFFFIANKTYKVPKIIEEKILFKKSKLGEACSEKKPKSFNLKDQGSLEFLPPNRLIIKPGIEYDKVSSWDFFDLLIEFLLDLQPLQQKNFLTITDAHRRLSRLIDICDIQQIGSNDLLPYRLWTKSRWTDLVGIYVLTGKEKQFLTFYPVALQLPSKKIQLVRPVYRMQYLNLPHQVQALVQSMLECHYTPQNIDSVYFNSGIVLVIMTVRVVQTIIYEGINQVTEPRGRRFDYLRSGEEFTLPAATPTVDDVDIAKAEPFSEMLKKSPSKYYYSLKSPSNTQYSSASSFGETFVSPLSLDGLVTQILIKLPTCKETLSYDISWSDQSSTMYTEVVSPECIYLFQCGASRIVFHFCRDFSLEVERFTDSLTGLTKLRCGMSRLEFDTQGRQQKLQVSTEAENTKKKLINSTSTQKASKNSTINENKSNSNNTLLSSMFPTSQGGIITSTNKPQNTTKSIIGAAKSPSKSISKQQATWWCSHPTFGVWYDSNSHLIKEIVHNHHSSNSSKEFAVSLLRFYSWGTLVLSSRVESPIAILLIEDAKLKKLVSNKIVVVIKGLSPAEVDRSEIDVAVTPNLERVYLCCKSQIVSRNIMPKQTKVEFELVESYQNRLKFKLAQVEIPSGAPTRCTLGGLYTFGILSEFCTKTGIYFQSQYSSELCPYAENNDYIISCTSPSKLETTGGTTLSEASDAAMSFDSDNDSIHLPLL